MSDRTILSYSIAYIFASLVIPLLILWIWMAYLFGNALGNGNSDVWYLSVWSPAITVLSLNAFLYLCFRKFVRRGPVIFQTTVVVIVLSFLLYLSLP